MFNKFLIILFFFACYLSFSSHAIGTPLIALREAQNCDGCHNGGRGQKPFFERRCTLDCQGCHIDPSGAGPRNQWGAYYTNEDLAMFNFFKPADPMKDESRIDFHYDGRIIAQEIQDGRDSIFPMSSEFSVRLRPFIRYLHFTYQNLLLGRIDDENFRIVREGDRRFRERYSVMVDNLPLNTYIRASRGIPTYGLRRPNHSLWIRQRIGLDQYATTEALEIGGTPNVPFYRVSLMTGDPYVAKDQRQKGVSYHAGMRGVTLGWHINGSGWKTKSEADEIDMRAFGGGFNVFGVLLYGERNWRKVHSVDGSETAEPSEADPNGLHPSSVISEYTIAYAGITGVMFGSVLEKLDDASRDSKRTNFFLDLHPIPFLQLEYWQRNETGTRQVKDQLAILHLLADF